LRSAAALIVVALVCSWISVFLVAHFSILNRLDQFVQDWEIASVFAPREAQDSEIVIVAVDEATLSRFSYRSPADRAFLSTLLRQLSVHEPKAIALDFLLDQPTEPEKDAMLHKTLRELKTPLVVSYIASPDTVTPEQKAFEDAMVPVELRGLADLPTDQFDTARDVFPGATVDGRHIPGLAYLLAAKAGVQTAQVRPTWIRRLGLSSRFPPRWRASCPTAGIATRLC
jgi:adenylate cyclase